jgi:hypothetical protein
MTKPNQLHDYPFDEVHVGVFVADTCNTIFEQYFCTENQSIERSVKFILKHIFKEITEEQTLLQTSRSDSSHY